jgi:hypothetical protein
VRPWGRKYSEELGSWEIGWLKQYFCSASEVLLSGGWVQSGGAFSERKQSLVYILPWHALQKGIFSLKDALADQAAVLSPKNPDGTCTAGLRWTHPSIDLSHPWIVFGKARKSSFLILPCSNYVGTSGLSDRLFN